MSADVTVIIPVYGDLERWRPLAHRAHWSAVMQSAAPAAVVVSVAETLSEARNRAAAAATTEWLIFCDADDELDVDYVAAMLAGDGDVRKPATLGIVDGVEDSAPVVIPERPLLTGNHIVIGAMVRRELFVEVGGFRDLPVWEDWDLFVRCWLAGATFGTCPEAIYRVHVRAGSRNDLTRSAALTTFRARSREYLQEARARGLA